MLVVFLAVGFAGLWIFTLWDERHGSGIGWDD